MELDVWQTMGGRKGENGLAVAMPASAISFVLSAAT